MAASPSPEPQLPESEAEIIKKRTIELVHEKLNQGLGWADPAFTRPLLPPDPKQPDATTDLPPTAERDKRHAKWVELLYAQYTVKFLNDNNRIWAIASIFIPLSLAGLLSLKDADLFQTFLLGMGSCLLMFFWEVIADLHRGFQTNSQNVVDAIESYVGFTIDLPKNRPSWIVKKSFFNQIQRIRWHMFWAVTIIWLLAFVGKAYDKYKPAPARSMHSFLTYHGQHPPAVPPPAPVPDTLAAPAPAVADSAAGIKQ